MFDEPGHRDEDLEYEDYDHENAYYDGPEEKDEKIEEIDAYKIKRQIKEWEISLNEKIKKLQRLKCFARVDYLAEQEIHHLLYEVRAIADELEEVSNEMWSVNR